MTGVRQCPQAFPRLEECPAALRLIYAKESLLHGDRGRNNEATASFCKKNEAMTTVQKKRGLGEELWIAFSRRVRDVLRDGKWSAVLPHIDAHVIGEQRDVFLSIFSPRSSL